MKWQVRFHDEFADEFAALAAAAQDELLSLALMLENLGPQLKRPHADTLKGSKYANMKELRFAAENGVWRVAFAFDYKRHGILLVAGDKAGSSKKRFYRQLIAKADERFEQHLKWLDKKGNQR